MTVMDFSEEKEQQPRIEERLWAWALFGAVMLPVVMHPGIPGLMAIVVGLAMFGLPAFLVGSFMGKFFGPPNIINMLLLILLCVVVYASMFDYVIVH